MVIVSDIMCKILDIVIIGYSDILDIVIIWPKIPCPWDYHYIICTVILREHSQDLLKGGALERATIPATEVIFWYIQSKSFFSNAKYTHNDFELRSKEYKQYSLSYSPQNFVQC